MGSGPTPDLDTISALVLSILREIPLADDTLSHDALAGSSRLLGKNAVLDSLGLVTLVVDLEQRLDEEYGTVVSIAVDDVIAQKDSPLSTVQSLAEYVHSLVLAAEA